MSELNFANYEVTPTLNVYELADGIIPKLAEAASYELTPAPDAANLGGLIGKLGPQKETQLNIELVKEALGENAHAELADMVEASGVMAPVERSFAKNIALPDAIDTLLYSGGVANWMMRRTGVAERFDPDKVGRVVLPLGKREVKPGEHQLAKTFEKNHGRLPTEADFARTYLAGRLATAGFNPEIVGFDESNGDTILLELFKQKPELLDGTIALAANAPNARQAAGQLRVAARVIDPHFDSNGDQLFMVSDSTPLARNGEPAKTHQNVWTVVPQIARDGLFLQRNIDSNQS